ncbi:MULTISPECIES: hypothetical protein [unclassified Caballeronia]|uniref:hypothetical protein n=1 Tax=unclassified Caballeronia TaxID=2646786 RepID=UPI00285759EB|nr:MULTISPECIES: hypothetical protein [unclassified Caballeronia]MDR5777438.1 hypothetical protein [Caballeronia sp. LZ002]MDR5852876.1 hypothetical protein [Caballeronia sp. LZ003]
MNVTITAHEAARTGDPDLHGCKFYTDDGAYNFREDYVTLVQLASSRTSYRVLRA